uniref:Protein kinase domain-containing protein n=1 Tax=Ananas comosus var. bracteatus TaxID=296719 RepID=A0A6V7PYB0_ANACO|nr:unnamed protein product [Ananas comosus var. bracteatus]
MKRMEMEIGAFNRKSEGNCILVGLQMDAIGRELLNWAITKLAEQGDRIVAVHICRKSDLSKTSTLSLIKVLEDYLTVFESLCGMKQVILVGRVTPGSSIQKVLVKEAKLCAAMAVVVGANKNYSFGGAASLAKEPIETPPGKEPKPVLRSVLHPSVGMNPKVIIPNSNLNEEVAREKTRLALAQKGIVEFRNTGRGRSPEVISVQWVMSLPNRSSPSIEPQKELAKELKYILETNSSSSKWFRYEDLRTATNQFSSENLIGKGGSSQVYKGFLSSGQQVAIKLSTLSTEAARDFLLEDNHLISVYDYLSRGSLEENLHGKGPNPTVSWDLRFKIALGIAEALTYLHTGCSKPVIHRDVKSSNILLTNDFEPQLSDFGLAIWAPNNSSSLTHSDVVGTFGYLAPEYFMYGKVSDKIDVYAFGVVLLELLTGRKPIADESPKGQESLVMWASPILNQGDVTVLLDPALGGNYNELQVRRMVSAASLCITRSARLRPQTNQILSFLKGGSIRELNKPNETDGLDDETYPASSVSSHLGLALQDVDDDESIPSFEDGNFSSFEEYLRGRWSRSSSFD